MQATFAAIQKFTAARKHHSSSLNVLANALHKIFTIPTDATAKTTFARERLRDACFNYLALGGASARGPVGLLSAYVQLYHMQLYHMQWCDMQSYHIQWCDMQSCDMQLCHMQLCRVQGYHMQWCQMQ